MAKAFLVLPLWFGLIAVSPAQPVSFPSAIRPTGPLAPAPIMSSAKRSSPVRLPSSTFREPTASVPTSRPSARPVVAPAAQPAPPSARPTTSAAPTRPSTAPAAGFSATSAAAPSAATLGPTGYPNYPGPATNLPVPNNYNDNPHVYVNVNNPTNPYGYYLNVPGVQVELAPIIIPTIRY